jgi:hypothetical protein
VPGRHGSKTGPILPPRRISGAWKADKRRTIKLWTGDKAGNDSEPYAPLARANGYDWLLPGTPYLASAARKRTFVAQLPLMRARRRMENGAPLSVPAMPPLGPGLGGTLRWACV